VVTHDARSMRARGSLARARRARALGGQRGAAIFVVMLVVVMLVGIGMLAARSTHLSTATQGSNRQATQTHYVTEFGMALAAAELSSARKEAYIRTMALQPDVTCLPVLQVPNGTCYRFGYEDLRKQFAVSTGNNAAELLLPANVATQQPGSLGYGDLSGGFRIDMTDLGPANPPVAGTDLTSSGAANITYMSVTMTATGQVRPRTVQNNAVDVASATNASNEALRSHLVVGPLPKL
jgi:hypothetical protein